MNGTAILTGRTLPEHVVEIDGKLYSGSPQLWREFCRPSRPKPPADRYRLTVAGWRYDASGEEVSEDGV